MSSKVLHYMVCGRLVGEDSTWHECKARSAESACEQFVAFLKRGYAKTMWRHLKDIYGSEPVVIEYIFRSDTPIERCIVES